MFLSNRFILLLLLGIIPILLGALIGGAFYIFLIYNVLLFAMLIYDFVITPNIRCLEVERLCEQKLSMGTDNAIAIKVRNNSGYPLDIAFTDEIPVYFKVYTYITNIKVLPHRENEGNYYVFPEKRGEFTFGKVHCRYKGVIGLCIKCGTFDLTQNYKVYPNIKDLRKYTLAALKKSQLMQGVKKVKGFGTGTEFESLREYAEGDDYKKINWLATARANKFIVNTYEPEKNQSVFIMLDSSRVMNSEIEFIKKLDYAINSAFLLADFVIKKGDNAGVMVFDSDVKRFIKPGKGMAHFQLIAENLYNIEENFVTADYKGALMYLNQHQKRRSLLCIFTELFNSDEAVSLAAALKNLARNHLPLIITIKDMRLNDIANSDVNAVEDVFLKSAAFRLLEEREKIKRIFYESGIACIDISPDKLSIEVLNKYIEMKSKLMI